MTFSDPSIQRQAVGLSRHGIQLIVSLALLLAFFAATSLTARPALVEVTSNPSGATVYLDYQATTNTTPVVLKVIGPAASHVVTVKQAGRPQPCPQIVSDGVPTFFDLTADDSGGLSIITSPAGADVYVDYADTAVGVSPILVENLAPGLHTILLRKADCLQPRPILATVWANMTNEVVMPLTGTDSTARVICQVDSVPSRATVYVNFLPTTNVTSTIVDQLDSAWYGGIGWYCDMHAIMLRKAGCQPSAPRYIDWSQSLLISLVNGEIPWIGILMGR